MRAYGGNRYGVRCTCVTTYAGNIRHNTRIPFSFHPLVAAIAMSVEFSRTTRIRGLILSDRGSPMTKTFAFSVRARQTTIVRSEYSGILTLRVLAKRRPCVQVNTKSGVIIATFLLPRSVQKLALATIAARKGACDCAARTALGTNGHCSFAVDSVRGRTRRAARSCSS